MQKISFLQKLLACFMAGLIAAIATQRIIFRTLWEFKDRWVPPPIFAAIPILLVLLLVIIYAISWHRKEKTGSVDSPRRLAFWQGVTRYFIAIDLSMIGWQKLFQLQFFTPLGRLDEPFSSFSGEQLTWAYFGHSYLFTCVIGLIQIAGSYLLLFRKTRLFGSILLFPVMLNIILIDLFYGFEIGESGHAIILMMGLLYLILQDYDRLVQFFFYASSQFPAIHLKSGGLKTVIRLSVVLIPFVLILSYSRPDKNSTLTGKYIVQTLLMNEKKTVITSCNDSLLTTVYFDRENDIVFEFNSQQRRLIGSYEFNKQNNHFKAVWRYPADQKDEFSGTLVAGKENELRLSGKIGTGNLEAVLLKIPQSK